MRERIRLRHYSLRTEQACVDWTRRFILFHGKRHPCEMGTQEVEAFLTHLAVERQVSASTQNQACSALLFLYKEALGIDLPWAASLHPQLLDLARQRIAPPAEQSRRILPVPAGVG